MLNGGLSPDGHYKVCILHDDSPMDFGTNGYKLCIENTESNKPSYTLESVGGWCPYAAAKKDQSWALWNDNSQFVAITDRTERHGRVLQLIDVSPNRIKQLELPDYEQNAFGRINTVSTDFSSFSAPVRWDKDNLIISYAFSANGRRHYRCEVTLHIVNHASLSSQASFVELTSVTAPVEVQE